MQLGHKRKVDTHCGKCGDRVIVTAFRGESFTREEVAEMAVGYTCADCDAEIVRQGLLAQRLTRE